uniref:Uncharacterized protein n=1 Tax=Arundo donax TaxID=35708 RepID=A0A0A8ZWB6_ARUDO
MSVSRPRTNTYDQPFLSVFRHGVVTIHLCLLKTFPALFSTHRIASRVTSYKI